MPLPLTQAQRTLPTTRAASEPENDPTFGELVGANFRSGLDEEEAVQNYRLDRAYTELVHTLKEGGHSASDFSPSFGRTLADQINPFATPRLWDGTKIWDAAQKAGIKGLPQTQEDFERDILTRHGNTFADDNLAARGSGIKGFAAGLVGAGGASFADGTNIATLPIGGFGKSFVTRILTEGLLNTGVEAVQMPGRIGARDKLGKETSGTDVAMQLVGAFFGGAAIRGGIELAPGAARKLGENVAGDWQRTRDYLWPRLPESVRARFGSKEALQPDHLPDIAEEVIGPGRLSQMERDAVDYARDAAEVKPSPFVENGAGQQLHTDLIGEAMDALIDLPPPSRLPVRGASGGTAEVRPGSRAGRVSGSNGFGDATSEARFMDRVRSAESSGNDAAKNPRSSATGRYQFTDGTWVSQFVKRYGRGGLSNAQILAKRTNGALQDQLMKDLTAENAGFLRSQGEAVTEGNLYLVHFSGQGGAKKVFAAAADTPIERVWSREVIEANPFLRGMTAGDVISWAHRKMGMAGNSPRAGAGFHLAEGGDGIDAALAREGSELETIRRSLDEAYAAQDAARRAALGEQDSDVVKAALSDSVAPRPFDDGALALDETQAPRQQLEPSVTPEQAALRSSLADIVHGSKDSINDLSSLAGRFDASEAEVRAALDSMVANGTITQNRRTGHFMRKPPKDDRELLESIARAGGLRDDEGHNLGLRSLSPEQRKGFASDLARARAEDKRAANGEGMGLGGLMTRSGPVLRHKGKSVDAIGEHLWDEGWFTERPTERQVLELIEKRLSTGEKMYPPGHEPVKAAAGDPNAQADFETEWDQWQHEFHSDATLARAFDGTLDSAPSETVMNRAAEIYAYARHIGEDSPVDTEQAIAIAVDEEYQRVLEDLAMQGMERDYGTRYRPLDDYDHFGLGDEFEFRARVDALRRADGTGGGRSPGASRDAGAGAPAGRDNARARADEVDPERLAELTSEQRAPFSDPDSSAAKAQADSLVHDLRAGDFYPTAEVADVTTVTLPKNRKGWKGGPDAELSVGRTPEGDWTYSYSVDLANEGKAQPFHRRDTFATRAAAFRKGNFELRRSLSQRYEDDAATVRAKNRISKWADDQLKAFDAQQAALPPSDKFMDEMATEFGAGTPEADGMTFKTWDGAEVTIARADDKLLDLKMITSSKAGAGTKAMKDIVKFADRTGSEIALYAKGFDGVPTSKLVEWYERFGFENLEGRVPTKAEEADPDHIGVDMHRMPGAKGATKAVAPAASVTTAKRMGDFIEFFDEDAKRVADALGITLTKRGDRPMSGVPVHAYEQYRAEAAAKGIDLPQLDAEGKPAAATKAVAATSADPRLIQIERTQEPPREGVLRGKEGMMLGTGDVVQTATGRETTAVPKLDGTSDRKLTNSRKRLDGWLIENAVAEAKARGDDFNGPMFERMQAGKLTQSDTDSLNMYLFGDAQPPVLRSPFKELGTATAPTLDNGAAVDPAIAQRQRTEAQLRAEAPMRGANRTGQEQDGTMGLGLFDAADQPEFLLDADAPGKTTADLLADLDKTEGDLKNIRDCL